MMVSPLTCTLIIDPLSYPRYITPMWKELNYRDAVAIQRLIASDAKKEDCVPKDRCMLARAYVELEMLKLRLRMKPAPKAIDVTKLGKNKGNSIPSVE
jgi:hypothetical protein